MKKYKIFLLSFFLLITYLSVCLGETPEKVPNNILFAEGFGYGGYGSVNYEYIFLRKKNFTFSSRIGIGSYHIWDFTNRFNPDIILPIGINAFYGKKHHVEFGIGQIISSMIQTNLDLQPKRKNQLNGGISIGYRYQKDTGGFFLRLFYSPIFEKNKSFRQWGGTSIGFVF